MKRITSVIAIMVLSFSCLQAQERIVKIDFESGSFYNNPKVPFDNSFVIMGETGKEIEFVKANISYEGKNYNLHSFVWNRIEQNKSETFSIVIPPVLRSNTKYDFEIITYRLITPLQKENLVKNVEDRVRFLLMNNIYFDGKNVVVNKPKEVYNKLNQLITESFKHFESKNFIPIQAPSSLVLEELKKQSDFRFGRFFKRTTQMERDDIAKEFVSEKVEHLVALIKSELAPFTNSQLVQHHRHVNVKSVETDKEPFTLPVNIGMYAWDKTASINNTSVHNINFTPGVGLTIPFNNKSQLISRSRMFDSFGFSAGVLLKPVVDNNGIEFLTPGVNLPVYTGLGFRVFKVARFNAGVLILGEKGNQGFDNLSVLPTAGLALELNLWMGIKK
ncbi:MAG TPA: hypothetical protein PLZ34_03185 [Prolixibacteraceae bacterium]|nr:hypothetical protein [Prolixibacteraceae bacterium]